MEEKEIPYPLFEKLYNSVNKIGDAVYSLNKKTEKIIGKIPEITATFLYVVLHIIISYFHEPWFDEGVAWQIAKCASLKDILFILPHYEGHPPLWHLILMPFARLGCPYEFSLALVSLIFSGLAVGLIIWRSPFPRLVRLLMPFTYFFFYQYSVISRPYCVMMLAFILAAVTFRDKDTKPWRFILSLMLLCLSSAYGILFAGGITVAWLIGLLKKEGFRFLLDKRRTFALFCLLVLAVLLILEILPESDTYAQNLKNYYVIQNTPFICLIYTFLVLPSDICATNIYSYNDKLPFTYLDLLDLMPGIIIGIIIWSALFYSANKSKTLLTLILPYSLFAAFSALKYIDLHHIGIVLFFFVFWAWSSCTGRTPVSENNEKVEYILFSIMRISGTLFMAVSIFWNISASIHEIFDVYGIGRNEAKFIMEHDLDDYNIMVGYQIYNKTDEGGSVTDEIIGYDFNHCSWPDGILAYFDRNIFFNLNDGRDDMAYTFHKQAGLEDCTDLIEKWRKQGAPDVIVMPPRDISAVYSGITDLDDYTQVYFSEINHIWKASNNIISSYIYVRTDLAEELGLERVIIAQ